MSSNGDSPAGLVGFRGSVTYTDGRPPEPFDAGPAVLADWELYAMRNNYPHRGDAAPAVLLSLFVAYQAVGDRAVGFDTWRANVYGVELETVDVPPTRPIASAG